MPRHHLPHVTAASSECLRHQAKVAAPDGMEVTRMGQEPFGMMHESVKLCRKEQIKDDLISERSAINVMGALSPAPLQGREAQGAHWGCGRMRPTTCPDPEQPFGRSAFERRLLWCLQMLEW